MNRSDDLFLSEDFEKLLRESLPDYAADSLLHTLSSGEPAEVSIRLNPFKSSVAEKDMLSDASEGGLNDVPEGSSGGVGLASVFAGAVPWCREACFLKERRSFTLDPAFHCGAYYVQDSSSMFLSLLVGLIRKTISSGNSNVLDLCASPGGKSTHLISLVNSLHTAISPADSTVSSSTANLLESRFSEKLPLVVCNEAVSKRVPPLTDNIAKWGAANVIVTGTSASNLGRLTDFFDVILADVPCSGEGMFRKSADAVSGWSLKGVEECAALQRSIIEDIWPALREGGLLVYSTCTYNHLENGDNVKHIAEELGAEIAELDDIVSSAIGFAGRKGVVKLPFGYQFVPGLVPGEGQFFAVLRKRAAQSRSGAGKQKSFGQSGIQKIAGAAEVVFRQHDPSVSRPVSNLGMDFFHDKSSSIVYMLPSDGKLQERMLKVQQVLGSKEPSCIKMFGCKVGEIKAGKLIPDADLALNTAMLGAETARFSVFPSKADKTPVRMEINAVEVGKETALKFLAKETITPQPEWPRGYVLFAYDSLGLGFVNNLGTRCNNLHPLHRRIRQNI